MTKRESFLGTILVAMGIFLLANNVFDFKFFSMERLWPVFVLGVGLVFEMGYFFRRDNPGLLVPGGILTTIGLLFFFETFTNWHYSAYTWPIYPLAVAIGLFQLYFYSGRNRGLLIPVFILTAVSVISFSMMLMGNLFMWLNMSFVLPAILILCGVGLILKNVSR